MLVCDDELKCFLTFDVRVRFSECLQRWQHIKHCPADFANYCEANVFTILTGNNENIFKNILKVVIRGASGRGSWSKTV